MNAPTAAGPATPKRPIILYSFAPAFGLPDPSHFVMKTEVQLKMAGLPYVKDPGGFALAPKGKLPYINDDGTVVADSTFIRAHLEQKYGLDLNQGLDPRQRAESWAIERMLEDHLGWAMGYFRWLDPANFAKGPAQFFNAAPEPARDRLREEARMKVTASMWGHGISRHRPEEIAELGYRSLAAASAMLGDRAFFMGEEPKAVDATALGVLAAVMTPFFDTPLRRRAETLPNLGAFVDRMMALFYAEHAWTPLSTGDGERKVA